MYDWRHKALKNIDVVFSWSLAGIRLAWMISIC